MSKCPFWSTNRKSIECYDACPIYEATVEDADCVFKAHLQLDKMIFKDIECDDSIYSSEKVFKLDLMDGISTY